MIHIVATGAANLASVLAAFDRLGERAVVTSDPSVISGAERVVLPGVGAFGAAMAALRAAGLVEVLRGRLVAGRPTLAVCLGLQLLAGSSEETPGEPGLEVLPGVVTRFSSEGGRRVPQMGWNRVAGGGGLVRDGWAYYANSYKLDGVPAGWAASVTDYGRSFIAAVERGGVLACQFHPELSGVWGMDLLRRWVRGERGQLTGPSTDLRQRASSPASGASCAMRVIPCLDVRDGRVVKGVKFQNLRDAGDPAQQAAEYERQGADELVMLDVSATPEGRKTAAETVKAIRKVLSIPLTVGGGVRAVEDAGRLLDAGADKVGVNTAAVEEPALLAELAQRFGRQCVVLAIDAARRAGEGPDGSAELEAWFSRLAGASEVAEIRARRTRLLVTPAEKWEVVVHSGKTRTGIDAVGWAKRGAVLGAGEILLTSYDRDGTGEGYDLDLLRAVGDAVDVPVIASGGARDAAHMAAAVAAGSSAVLAASIFHDGIHTVGAVKRELAERGVAVRMEEA